MPLRILFINQFFYPDISATSQYLTDLAEDFINYGFSVYVITGRSSYISKENFKKRKEIYKGIKIIRVFCTNFGRQSNLGRMIDYLSFYVCSLLKTLSLSRIDVLITLTTPPFIALIGSFFKIIRKVKHICWIQDVYPELAIKLGVLNRRGLFTYILKRILFWSLKKSDAIVVIGDYMKNRIVEKGISKQKIKIVYNWANEKEIKSIPHKINWFRKQISNSSSFLVQYSGNFGMGHDFETIKSVILKIQYELRIKFIFIGDGVRKNELIAFKEKNKLNNMLFLPYQKRKILSYSLSSADVSLVTLSEGLEGLIIPSKIYGILSSARPVIYLGNMQSEIADIIASAECGFVINHGDVHGLKNSIMKLFKSQSLKFEMGIKARQYLCKHFRREDETKKFAQIVNEL